MVQYNNYALGTGTELLYPVNGEACDWMYGVHQIFAYTPEIGSQSDGFWPATNRIVPLAEENLYPNKFVSIHAGAVLKGTITTSEGPFIQGESYPLYFQIENAGLSESESVTDVSFISSEIDIDIDDINIGSIDGRSIIDFEEIGYYTVPQNLPNGESITIEVNILNDQEFCYDTAIDLQIGQPELIIDEDFESNSNWTVENTSSAGFWERAIPNGTIYQGQQ
jgi:hypothetical protein